jgi:adenine-specific DNA methylase
MGSKFRLLPWIHQVVSQLDFDTVLDAFCGSACVGYLLKAMGKEVTSNDFLNFTATIARATVENPGITLGPEEVSRLQADNRRHPHFIEQTFSEIFFAPDDLRFLDRVWSNLGSLKDPYKRYHFLEGLSCYWNGLEILQDSVVKKIRKPYTPFSYRKSALDAFDKMFQHFSRSIIVLSYSSNGYPDLDVLTNCMKRYKRSVTVHEKPHRYHFGTHEAAARNEVLEYLIVGR